MESDGDEHVGQNEGDISSAHAQKPDEGGATRGKTSLDASISKVVSTLERRVSEFSKTSKNMTVLAEAVKHLTSEVNSLKRKKEEQDHTSSQSQPPTKRGRVDSEPRPHSSAQSDNEAEVVSDVSVSDSDIDGFMDDEGEEEDKSTEQDNDYDDLEQYFEPVWGVGEEVGSRIAKITNKALMGKNEADEEKGEEEKQTKNDKDKLDKLKQKHLRPKNIEYLQVPDVDDILWRQLKRDVRQVDFQMKKANHNHSQALVPVIKAMEYMKTKNYEKASEHIMDAFKMLCLTIKSNIAGRRERIKKELEPRFKALCNQEATPNKLFRDNLQENIKKLEGTKTSLTTSQKNFLGKKGGNRQQYQQNRGKQHRHQRSASQSHGYNQSNNRFSKPYYKKRNSQPAKK